MTTEDIINQVTDEIIEKINPNWNKLQKIRFVYLELGSFLEKNTDFFLHDKLASFALSDEEKHDVYFSDKLYETKHLNQRTQYQIVCKSAALFLKTAYDKLGIESIPITTVGKEEEVKHWFIVCKDDEDKQYFLTLAADLPFIKNNLPTEHFASNIIFVDRAGNITYEIPEDCPFNLENNTYIKADGSSIDVTELAHTLLSSEELVELDRSIGYDRLYELQDFFSEKHKENAEFDVNADLNSAFNSLFISLALDNSEIFEIYRSSFDFEKGDAVLSRDITREQVDTLKNNLDNYMGEFLAKKTGLVSDNDDKLRSCVINLLGYAGVTNVPDNVDYITLLKVFSKQLRTLSKDSRYSDVLQLVQGVMTIENRFYDFLGAREDLEEKEKNGDKDEIIKTREKYLKARENISIKKMNPLLERVAFLTNREKIEYPRNNHVSLEYIVNKFETLFPVVFDCNSSNNKTKEQTSFSIQSYSEQKVIIRLMLERMFSELTYTNSCEIENYDLNYNAVENRIRTYPIKDKETGEYCIAFNFGAKVEENSVEYVYIPSSNLLRRRDPLKEKDKYFIVSNHFNREMEKMEENLIDKPSSGVKR